MTTNSFVSESTISYASGPVRSPRRPRIAVWGVDKSGFRQLAAMAGKGTFKLAAAVRPAEEVPAIRPDSGRDMIPVDSLRGLLALRPDALVIGPYTPEAPEVISAALEAGLALFCPNPPAPTRPDMRQIVNAARQGNTLLGIDRPFRHIDGLPRVRQMIRADLLGDIYAIDLAYHQARAGSGNRESAVGGRNAGCLQALGLPLLDMALWLLGFPRVNQVCHRLLADGRPLREKPGCTEDYAVVRLDLATGAPVQLSCSWNAPIGENNLIRASLYGTKGGVEIHNQHGSPNAFTTTWLDGRRRHLLGETGPQPNWRNRPLREWLQQLTVRPHFNPEVEQGTELVTVLEAAYGW